MSLEIASAVRHCPGCGEGGLSWPTSRSLSCPECGFLLYLNTAAAAAVIIEYGGSILFGLRRNEPGKGKLDLPGGFVDPGETAEEGALREVREETGLELTGLRYLFSLPNVYHYRGVTYNTLDLVFHCRLTERPVIQAADDLEELLWIDFDDIVVGDIAFDSLRRAVQRFLASHGGRDAPDLQS